MNEGNGDLPDFIITEVKNLKFRECLLTEFTHICNLIHVKVKLL